MKSHDADCSVKRSAIVIFMVGSALLHRRRKEVWDGAKPQGVWGTRVPGSRGGAPVGSLGNEVPQKLKNF